MIELSIVAPVYNEAASLRRTLARWLDELSASTSQAELILVFDGCSDSSFSVAEQTLASSDLSVILIDEPVNSGAGKALSKGMQQARGQFILLLDSDGQFQLGDGLKLYDRICKYEGAVAGVGVRSSKGSFFATCLWKFSNLLFRWKTGVSLRDPSCALKVFSQDPMTPSFDLQTRWNYSLEMTMELHCRGYRFVEAFVDYGDRSGGNSNFHLIRDGFRRLKFLLSLKRRHGKSDSF